MKEPEKPKIRLMHTLEPDENGKIFVTVRIYDPFSSEPSKQKAEACLKRGLICIGQERK